MSAVFVGRVPRTHGHPGPTLKTPNDFSIAKLQQLVELKDYRGPTKKEYVRYVRNGKVGKDRYVPLASVV